MTELLVQITAPGQRGKKGFCAGLVLWDDEVVQGADIVRYMKGWSRDHVRDYCKRREWTVKVVSKTERERT